MAEQEFTTEELQNEEWKTINHYPDYEISSLGRVRSQKNYKQHTPGRFLKRYRGKKDGYLEVQLYSPGQKRRCMVATLVAEAFICDRPTGMCINHKDTIKINNRVSNLEWLSAKQNSTHAAANGCYRTGMDHPQRAHPELCRRGELVNTAKMTPDSVREIRRLHASGMTNPQIGNLFGITRQQARKIVIGENWSHIKD